jgi:hypothetical protein
MDWFAAALGVTGCALVGKRIRVGWILFACASAINIAVGIKGGILGMACASAIYLFLEIQGWWNHHKNKDK